MTMLSREEAVAAALTWKGTPYVLRGRVKGAGCDCATLLLEYLLEIGATDAADVPSYTADWFHHAKEERYLSGILRHAVKVAEGTCAASIAAEAGNLVLFQSMRGGYFNHGAIVLRWPKILHATATGVKEVNATLNVLTANRRYALFDPWKKPEYGEKL